jgi:heat shock transcription factor
VLDEDEFARTLIPELFKHNNYASFVRQLNMYGFHKKVGLSDNSMKASETKAKAPSEYYNKYFKRGRQELLWLIQKPKNPITGPKRKRDEENKGDSDDDRKYIQDTGGGGYVEEVAVRGNEQMAMIRTLSKKFFLQFIGIVPT